MAVSFKSQSMVFDREDLRVLRSAYDQALKRLRQSRMVREQDRAQLARTVLDIGWMKINRGFLLRGAEALIANDAIAHLTDDATLALCA